MTSPASHRASAEIDGLMARACEALSTTRWFDAERLAVTALGKARALGDFLLMARICLPLQEARRLRLSAALDIGERLGVGVLDSALDEGVAPPPGCWLAIPPLVGADARRMRLAALSRGVPASILCREPRTKAGRWPVVAVGALVVRVHLDPPPGPAELPMTVPPPLAWFVWALEALGDAALAKADAELDPVRRIDALLARLDAHPDHEKLHQALEASCRAAHAHLEPGAGVDRPKEHERSRWASSASSEDEE